MLLNYFFKGLSPHFSNRTDRLSSKWHLPVLHLFSMKNGKINSTSIRKSIGFNVHVPFWPKPMYSSIYSFTALVTKKHQKMKIILHQQNLQSLSFLWNKKSSQYHFMNIPPSLSRPLGAKSKEKHRLRIQVDSSECQTTL